RLLPQRIAEALTFRLALPGEAIQVLEAAVHLLDLALKPASVRLTLPSAVIDPLELLEEAVDFCLGLGPLGFRPTQANLHLLELGSEVLDFSVIAHGFFGDVVIQ